MLKSIGDHRLAFSFLLDALCGSAAAKNRPDVFYL